MNERYQLFIAIYRWLLRLFSARFRQEFGEEMITVFAEQLEAAGANGRFALFTLFLHELGGLAVESGRQWFYAWQTRPLLLAQVDGRLIALTERGWPWRKILFLIACLIPLLPVVVFLAGLNAMRISENRLEVNQVALADFDSDGRLDALIILNRRYMDHPYNHILVNKGNGLFAITTLWPEGGFAQAIATGDLDSDGHVDVVIANFFGGLARYLNDGSGAFIPFGVVPDSYAGSSSIRHVALGDLNDDGRLDAFVAGCCPGGEVWLNRGDGLLSSSRQRLGQMPGYAVALADLNGDGSLDAFLISGTNGPYTIWFNDGQGNFSDSGQQLGASQSFAVALGDVNGDGFPDAVVGNEGADEIWLNDGQGNFSLGQRFGRGFTSSLFLADLDGDGDLDIIAGSNSSARVWLNSGPAHFREGQHIRYGRYEAIALGDVTGDGIVDIFVGGVKSYRVWQGEGNGRFTASRRTDYR